jgi:NAD(P)-dependent dehydrogenase (short-subunit alcohol dehydrogenase family)
VRPSSRTDPDGCTAVESTGITSKTLTMASPEGVAIVTGGTSCLGAAAARSLAPTHMVAITDLPETEADARQLIEELGADRAVFIACDVRWMQDCHVCSCAVNAEQNVLQSGHTCLCVRRSEESIAAAFKEAVDHFQLPLTTLVNNAAVTPLPNPAKTLDTADMQDFDETFAASSPLSA